MATAPPSKATSPKASPGSGMTLTGGTTSASAVKLLTAIAHEGRLNLIRRLVQAGPEGIVAGELARAAKVAATTASAQLLVLANADLVRSKRNGRQIIYSANYSALEGLLAYLLEDCCGGRREVCGPIAQRLAAPPPDGCCGSPEMGNSGDTGGRVG